MSQHSLVCVVLFVGSIDACEPLLPLAIALPLPRRVTGIATAKQQRKRDGRHAEQNGPPAALQFLSKAQPHSQPQRRNVQRGRFLKLEGKRILVLKRWMPFQTNKDQIIKDKSESGERAPECNSDKITRRHRVQR